MKVRVNVNIDGKSVKIESIYVQGRVRHPHYGTARGNPPKAFLVWKKVKSSLVAALQPTGDKELDAVFKLFRTAKGVKPKVKKKTVSPFRKKQSN